jgi:hypothetical protein
VFVGKLVLTYEIFYPEELLCFSYCACYWFGTECSTNSKIAHIIYANMRDHDRIKNLSAEILYVVI